MKHLIPLVAAGIGLALVNGSAHADQTYVFGTVGYGGLGDSENEGAFTSDFTTGTGTTIPLGTPLPSGTPVAWESEFDGALAFAAGFGRHFGDGFRAELELGFQANDVETHNNVKAAGLNLTDEDAAVLISGSPALGATVGTIVAAGEGEVSNTFVMVNGYYDFREIMDGPVSPYVGAGIGVSNVKVEFSPSGVGIIDDSQTVFSWQLMGGLNWDVEENMTLYAGGRYRATGDVEVDIDLFPAALEIENRGMLFEVGLRYRF